MSSAKIEVPKTPEELSAEAAERIRISSEAASKQVAQGAATAAAQIPAPSPAPAYNVSTMSAAELEEVIKKVLGAAPKAVPPSTALEPDWAKLSEKDALNLSNPISIPVIEHEVPSYLEMQLADPEYVCVWANRDQRRLGQLLAEGYELLKKEHVSPSFPVPLKWDGEGLYVYQDVIAMRVHKRILFAKRRKVVEKSYLQLKGLQQFAKQKIVATAKNDLHLGEAFESGSMGFYEAEAEAEAEA